MLQRNIDAAKKAVQRRCRASDAYERIEDQSGDAGRWFAVVASEVRALAQRSTEAAKEIKKLITASRIEVEGGVEMVGKTGVTLGRIATEVSGIAAIVGDIHASAQEQASSLDQVNTAINQIDQVTQQYAAMVEQTTAACAGLAQEAQDLMSLVEQFKFQSGGDALGRPFGGKPKESTTRPKLKLVQRA